MKYFWFALLFIIGSIGSASASISRSDWKSAGDQMIGQYTGGSLQWLSLKATSGLSPASVNALFSTTYSGWRYATAAEVNQMFDDMTPYNLSLLGRAQFFDDKSLFAQWISLMGQSAVANNGATTLYSSKGIYLATPSRVEFTGFDLELMNATQQVSYNLSRTYYKYFLSTSLSGIYSASYGSYLVRDIPPAITNAVSAPGLVGSFGVIALGVMMVRVRRRRV